MIKRNQSSYICVALALLMLMLLSACSGLRPREDVVRVNLSNLKMLESTVFEQRFEASMRIQNRSQSELSLKGLSFDLALNDKDFASGVSNQQLVIAPLSEGVVTVNLTSTLFSLIRQFQSMQEMQNKPFSYDLHGRIFTDQDYFGVSFSEKGEIDLTTPADQPDKL